MTEKPLVTIYTDGGCEPNPGPGGWAAILLTTRSDGLPHSLELSGGDPDTTNNRMELTAAIQALRTLKKPCRVVLHTDSEYVKKGITEWLPGWIAKGWRTSSKTPVKNQDLWQALDAETQRHEVKWCWVKGHAGNEYNERVDRLAAAEIKKITAAQLAPSAKSVTPPKKEHPPEAQPALFPAPVPVVLAPLLSDRAWAWEQPDGSTIDESESGPFVTLAGDEKLPLVAALRVRGTKTGNCGGWAVRIGAADASALPLTFTGRVTADDESLTHQRLELTAALEIVQRAPADSPLRVYCPSEYLYEGITRWCQRWQASNWRTQEEDTPVQNQDLWEKLLAVCQDRAVEWVREPHPAPLFTDRLRHHAIVAAREDDKPKRRPRHDRRS
jgi:ribonuclease HI